MAQQPYGVPYGYPYQFASYPQQQQQQQQQQQHFGAAHPGQQFPQPSVRQHVPKKKRSQALAIVDPETKEAILPVPTEASAEPAATASSAQSDNAAVQPSSSTAASAQAPAKRTAALSITTPTNSNPVSAEASPTKTAAPSLPEISETKAAAPIDAQPTQPTEPEAASTNTAEATDVSSADADNNDEDDNNDDDEVFGDEPSTQPAPSKQVEYEDGCWSPSNPEGKKAYSLQFLLQFRPVCKRRLEDGVLTSQQARLLTGELFGPGEPTGVAQRVGSGGGKSSRSRRPSNKQGVQNVPFAQSGPGRAKPKQISLGPRVAKLERGENAFVPTAAKDKKQKQPKSEEEKVQAMLNKAQSVLNKMTLEKFDKLSDELISIGTDMPDEALAQFVERIFQKAIDEPFFSKMYAQLCTKCSMATLKGKKEPILPKFRPLLLKACQQKFQQDNQDAAKTKEFEERQAREASEVAKGDGTTNKDHLSKQDIEDEKLRVAKARRRTLGNIKFIGELFLCNMVSANVIVNSCIEPLLKSKADDEDSLECLCKLMETTGAKLEGVANTPALKNTFNGYMSQMEALAKRKGIPSRVKFMILDVLDMRKRGWEARNKDAGPKKLSEIHQEAEQQAKEIKRKDAMARAERQSSSGSRGRHDRRNNPPPASTVRETVKADRMRMTRPKASGGGRPKQLLSRQAAPKEETRNTTNSFAKLMSDDPPESPLDAPTSEPSTPASKFTPEVMKRKVKGTLDEYLDLQDKNEAIECLKELESEQGLQIFISELGEKMAFAKPAQCDLLIALLEDTIEKELVNGKTFCLGMVEPLKGLEEMAMDAPKAYDVFARILAVGIQRQLVKAPFLAADHVTGISGMNAFRFVLRVFNEVNKLAGEQATRDLFAALETKKTVKSYLPERTFPEDYTDGFKRYDVEFLLQEPAAAPAPVSDEIWARLLTKLKSGTSNEDIMAMVDKEVTPDQQTQDSFVVNYAKTIVMSCLPVNDDKPRAFSETEQDSFIKAMQARAELLQVPPESKLFLVYGLQAVAAQLEFPAQFFYTLCFTFYNDLDLIDEAALNAWRSDEDYEGDMKGTAKSELEPLFEQLANSEESA
eukprot:TRINITY_DN12005_c0_g2_i2.p1 TRINITY_DN12005_c0_g2~~TRINITY_DN12005_c0_g2_i2.p1  ORF type:complete len:1094 (+),score=387.11 TRINITY_DN12005_c0_g2_i2:75-3356(+)